MNNHLPTKPATSRTWTLSGAAWLILWLAAASLFGWSALGKYATSRPSAPLTTTDATFTSSGGPKKTSLPSGHTTKPIEQLRVGDRVVTSISDDIRAKATEKLDSALNTDADGAEVDPATWQAVHLTMKSDAGEDFDIVLLRSKEWVKTVNACVGSTIHLRVSEQGLDGQARIVAIEDRPEITTGDGELVTGTFTHVRGGILRLHLSGISEPLCVTENHTVYSETRRDFVHAEELQINERLLHLNGTTEILQIDRMHTSERVYNLEINHDHVFRVTPAGVLVHNNSEIVDLWKAPQPGRSGAAGEVVDGFLPENYPGEGVFFALAEAKAGEYRFNYQNGMQRVRIPRALYDQLVQEGVILPDENLPNSAIRVPPDKLPRFNEAMRQGPPNEYSPEGSP